MSRKMLELKSDLDAIRVGNHLIRCFMHDAYDDEEIAHIKLLIQDLQK